jgi:hypothetical protein
MIYSNVDVPQDADISSATVTLSCTTPSGTSGQLDETVYGFYKTSTNLHPDLFTSSGSNQLKTPLATSSLHTSASASVSSNNCPPGNNTVWDVTNVVQEIVDNNNWDPATGGGRMGFVFSRASGKGSRHLLKNSNALAISYSATTLVQAQHTDPVGQWDDQSGNGNNAVFVFGSQPTLQDNQINSMPIVRFSNGALVSTLNTALSGEREFTAFAVIKPNFATSGSDGRVISGMSTGSTSDTTSGTSLIPLRRQSNATGFSALYDGNVANNAIMGCNPSCSSTPYLAVSRFMVDDTNDTITADLRGNGGSQTGQTTNISPGTPPPAYTFGIDQIYFGGRRTGAMPGSGTDYFNGDYAELVVYDGALSCREIEDLEEYFRAKWNIAGSQWDSVCPAQEVPTL